ncbi:hypothetical protein [Euzebya tangerina]|uniref:hypothetical protein n=1 Tax=Euzebya tangerina TaxID=591198 RepID=UPI0013C34C2E|nr:hypothetical protein [Euzebya tangerina]
MGLIPFLLWPWASEWFDNDEPAVDPTRAEPLVDHGPHEGVAVQVDARGERIVAQLYATSGPGGAVDLGSSEGIDRVIVPDAADAQAPAAAWTSRRRDDVVLTIVDDVALTAEDPPTIDMPVPVDEIIDLASLVPTELGLRYQLVVFGRVAGDVVSVPITVAEEQAGADGGVIVGDVQRMGMREFPPQLELLRFNVPNGAATAVVVGQDPLVVVDETGRRIQTGDLTLRSPIELHEPPPAE